MAMATRAISEDSRVVSSFSNPKMHTNRREAVTKSTLHLPVRHLAKKREMVSSDEVGDESFERFSRGCLTVQHY